jgi:hypothetical protein
LHNSGVERNIFPYPKGIYDRPAAQVIRMDIETSVAITIPFRLAIDLFFDDGDLSG